MDRAMAKLMAGLSQLNLLQPVKAVVNTVKLKKKKIFNPPWAALESLDI